MDNLESRSSNERRLVVS